MGYGWFDYGYHGSKATGTYFDCVVVNVLFDGNLYVVTKDGECVVLEPWSFTKAGKIGIDFFQEYLTPAAICAERLREVCAAREGRVIMNVANGGGKI